MGAPFCPRPCTKTLDDLLLALTDNSDGGPGSPFYRGGGDAARRRCLQGSQSGGWGLGYVPVVRFLRVMVGGWPAFASGRTGSIALRGRLLPARGSSKEGHLDGSLELPGHLAGFYSCCGRSSPALGCALEASSSPASPRGLDAGLAPQISSSVRESGRFDLCRRPGGSSLHSP